MPAKAGFKSIKYPDQRTIENRSKREELEHLKWNMSNLELWILKCLGVLMAEDMFGNSVVEWTNHEGKFRAANYRSILNALKKWVPSFIKFAEKEMIRVGKNPSSRTNGLHHLFKCRIRNAIVGPKEFNFQGSSEYPAKQCEICFGIISEEYFDVKNHGKKFIGEKSLLEEIKKVHHAH